MVDAFTQSLANKLATRVENAIKANRGSAQVDVNCGERSCIIDVKDVELPDPGVSIANKYTFEVKPENILADIPVYVYGDEELELNVKPKFCKLVMVHVHDGNAPAAHLHFLCKPDSASINELSDFTMLANLISRVLLLDRGSVGF